MLNRQCYYVSYKDLSMSIHRNLFRIPQDIDLVVGIPRSGMIPAYIIGLSLNIAILDIDSFMEDRTVGKGHTRDLKRELPSPLKAKKILLVDDSYYSGTSLCRSVNRIKQAGFTGDILTCAAIILPNARKNVDIYFIEIPAPRVFEWNLFHHYIIGDACLDLDGVLCVDPTEEENDDGENYRTFLLNAKPLYVPTQEIGHIVSARLEKYRKETEQWLMNNGVRYNKLHLLNLPSKEARIKAQAHVTHKIEVYIKTGAMLFIESNPDQAKAIASGTGKPVLCVENMEMLQGDGLHLNNLPPIVKKRGKLVFYYIRSKVAPILPTGLKKSLKLALKI